jgi:hypothetical protein
VSRPQLSHSTVRVRVGVNNLSETSNIPTSRASNPFNVFGDSSFSGTSSRLLSSSTIMTPRQAAPATTSNDLRVFTHEPEVSLRQSSYSGSRRNQETNEELVGDRNNRFRNDPCVDHLLPASTNSRTATQLLQHPSLSEQRDSFNFFFQEHDSSNAASDAPPSTAYSGNFVQTAAPSTHSNTSSSCLGPSTSSAVATTSHASSQSTKFKLNINAPEFVPRSHHVQPQTTSIGPIYSLPSTGLHANGNLSLISQHENNGTLAQLTPAASAFGIVFQGASLSASVNPQFPLRSIILTPLVPNVSPLSTAFAPPQITCMTPVIHPQMTTNMPNSSLSLTGGSITGMRLPNSQIAGMTYPLINMLPPQLQLPDSLTSQSYNSFPHSGRLNPTESFHAVTSRRWI